MARKSRNVFADLPDDWKTEMDQTSTEDISAEIARLAMAEAENLQAKADDQDLKDKKDAVKFAAEGYRESTKGYRLRMKYILSILEGRGRA